jgi:hypothetical protein
MGFCILRTAKLKTFGNLAGSGDHNFRARQTDNADPNLTHLNETHGAQSTEEIIECVKARLATVPTIRKNAVLAVEYFIGASPEYFQNATKLEYERYFDNAEKWLKKIHGAENVIAVTRHYDETSPHLCAYVVPIDPAGKLNASHFYDGRAKLQQMQTAFAEQVGAPAGLERGVEGSKAEHTTIKTFYGAINAPTPPIKTQVPPVPEPTIGEVLKESMGINTTHSKAVEAAELAKKKRAQEIKAQREAEQAKAKSVQLLQKAIKGKDATIAHFRDNATILRKIPLKDVLERSGATPDPKDKDNWRTSMGRISVKRDTEKFFNHDTSTGGGGAIDMAMHLEGCDYKSAVQWLADNFGVGAVVSDVAAKAKQEVMAIAAEPPKQFEPPAPSPAHWPGVRDYLMQIRKISGAIIDALHEKGRVYADASKNAVFVLQKKLGVELRGTNLDYPFKGFRGQKAGFFLRKGDKEIKKVAFVESSIEAISLFELDKFEGLIVAIGGDNAAMARQTADAYREQGYKIYSAFNNDKAGEHQALILGESIRLKPKLNDWNDELRKSKEPKIIAPPAIKNRAVDNDYARMRG